MQSTQSNGSMMTNSVQWHTEDAKGGAAIDDSDPSEPPAGYTDDLSGVRVGSAVIAFYATEGLWYAATVNGVYPASDGTENGVVHDKYYWITFTGYDTSESVYAEGIRVKEVVDDSERKLQPGGRE